MVQNFAEIICFLAYSALGCLRLEIILYPIHNLSPAGEFCCIVAVFFWGKRFFNLFARIPCIVFTF